MAVKQRDRKFIFQDRPTKEPRHYKGNTRYARKQSGDVIGVRGLKTLAGLANEEYRLTMPNWNRRIKIFLEMRDDAIISTLLDAIKLPLLAAPFETRPAEENTPGDIAAAEWLYDAMHRMYRQAWKSHVSDCLDAIDFGFNVSEIILEKRADGRMWPKNIDVRAQETLKRWKWRDDQKDELELFIQTDPDTGAEYEVPVDKCVHVTFRGRKGNPEGKALLATLFRPWRIMKDLENLEAVGVERDVGGMPVAKLPIEGAVSSTDIDDMETALKGMRNDENSYLILPPGVEVSPYGSGTKQFQVGAIIERYQKLILGVKFAQFLKLGMDKVGTQSLVKGATDFFMLGLESVQDNLTEAWNQQLVPYLINHNSFPGMTDYPEIYWQPPGKIDAQSLIEALNMAAGAKIFTPTDIDEDHVRELLDLPELPEEERGQSREVEQPPIGGLFEGNVHIPKALDKISVLEANIKEQSEKLNRLSNLNDLIKMSKKQLLKIPTPADWEKEYEGDLPHWATDLNPSQFAQDFVEQMQKSNCHKVLEIGCGNGRDSIFFAEAGFNVNAVDITPKAIEIAKGNAQNAKVNIDFRVANSEKLPFSNNDFDAVYTLSVLHSTDLQKSIKELSRVLKSGGLSFIYIYADAKNISGKDEQVIDLNSFIELLKSNKLTMLDLYTETEDEYDQYGDIHRIFVALARKK